MKTFNAYHKLEVYESGKTGIFKIDEFCTDSSVELISKVKEFRDKYKDPKVKRFLEYKIVVVNDPYEINVYIEDI